MNTTAGKEDETEYVAAVIVDGGTMIVARMKEKSPKRRTTVKRQKL